MKVSCVSRDEFEEVLGPLQSIIEMDRKFKERNAVQKELAASRPSWGSGELVVRTQVGRCRLTLSNPESKARLVSALETKM